MNGSYNVQLVDWYVFTFESTLKKHPFFDALCDTRIARTDHFFMCLKVLIEVFLMQLSTMVEGIAKRTFAPSFGPVQTISFHGAKNLFDSRVLFLQKSHTKDSTWKRLGRF